MQVIHYLNGTLQCPSFLFALNGAMYGVRLFHV